VAASLPFGGAYLSDTQKCLLYGRFYKRRVKLDLKEGRRGPRTQHGSWSDFMRHKRARMYGMDGADLEHLEGAQGNVCAICGEPEQRIYRGKTRRSLDIDHDHATGEIRGLLCSACNRMLANARDNPEVLRKAAGYLEMHTNFA